MSYTDEQVKYIKELRNDGLEWEEVADQYNTMFPGERKTANSLRKTSARYGGTDKVVRVPKTLKPIKLKKAIPMSNKSDSENYSTIMVISDTHFPNGHQDVFPFLKEVKRIYSPDKVVHIGDEVDKHSLSFHDSDPDLMSAGDELSAAIEDLRPLYKLFPEVDLLESNHGSLVYRKAKHHGIPVRYIRDYGDVLEAPKGWKWHSSLKLRSGDNDILFRHQFKKNGLQAALMENCCTVQGHFHTDATVAYGANSYKLLWGMTVGCLIDDDSLAFSYNKTDMKRPILSIGLIIDGHAMILPMVLDSNGRWIGKLV